MGAFPDGRPSCPSDRLRPAVFGLARPPNGPVAGSARVPSPGRFVLAELPLREARTVDSSRNLAARAGRWSARHRKTAVFGWLAFVVLAFVLGGAIGTKTLADEDSGNGESRLADAAINRADFPDDDDQQVLVTARKQDLHAADAEFK